MIILSPPRLLILLTAFTVLTADATPDFPARDFGATGDGTTLDTAAIQKAIDAARVAGGGRVVLAAGTYRSGSIRLKDKIELHLEESAILLGSDKLTDYQRGNWPALILAEGVSNIAITGKGTLNGNSPELVKEFDRIKESGNALAFTPHTKPGEELVFVGPTGSPMKFNPHQLHEQGKLMEHLYGPHPRPYEYVRPQIIEMQNCKGVTLRDITIRDAACWVQTYRSCEDMLIERITVRSTSYWNNDGIDIVDCRRVQILDCDIDSADDALCLKSDPPGPGCEDITVKRCKLASRASAIKFGTGSHHGFKRIHISDIEVRDTYRSVVAIQTVDGAVIDDVRVERVKATNTGNAFAIRLGHRTQSKPPGSIANIILRDFDVEIPPLPENYHREIGQNHNLIPASIVGMPGHPVRGVHMSNIKIRYAGKADRNHAEVPLDQLDSIPNREKEYPEFTMWGELPAWAFYIRHAEDVTIENSTFTLAAADFRPAIVADHAPRLVLDKLTIGPSGGEPVIAVRKSPHHRIEVLKAPAGTKEPIRRITD
jgi:hypothetical protein